MSPVRLRPFMLLLLSTVFSLALIGFRVVYTGKITYLFLVWNLVLAWVPYLISRALNAGPGSRNLGVQVFLIGLWLLFFPNAPYILTDLFHLRYRFPVPLWYDLVVILSALWTGLMLGFLSLLNVQQVVTRQWSATAGWLLTGLALILGSFGIYLGRYLRWNSWDIVTNPFALAYDILDRLLHPLLHFRAYGVTLLFSVFLLIAYLTLHLLIQTKTEESQ